MKSYDREGCSIEMEGHSGEIFIGREDEGRMEPGKSGVDSARSAICRQDEDNEDQVKHEENTDGIEDGDIKDNYKYYDIKG